MVDRQNSPVEPKGQGEGLNRSRQDGTALVANSGQSKTTPPSTAVDLEKTSHQILNEGLSLVKAKRGSLMLVEGGYLRIDARYGPPNPARERDPVFEVGDGSIAGWVAKTGKAYLCPDIGKDPHFAPPPGKLNFGSLLTVPFIFDKTVVGVINADNEEPNFFDVKDKQELSDFADRMAVAVAERIRRHQILDSLHGVGVSLTSLSPEGLADVLKEVAEQAVDVLGIDLVTLYQYDQGTGRFPVEGAGPIIAGELLWEKWEGKRVMETNVHPGDDIPWKIVNGGRSRFFSDAKHDEFLVGTGIRRARDGLPERPCFVHREKIKSSAALVLRIGEEIVGVMFANYRIPHRFKEDEQRILEIFANYAAIAIKNARLFEQEQAARKQLKMEQDRRVAAERLAILSDIAANFAHAMSNVGGTIPVAVQEIRRRVSAEDESLMRYLQRIEEDSRRLMDLAEQLRRPLEARPAEWTHLNELLSGALRRVEVPVNVEVLEDHSEKMPAVTVSRSQLMEVFVNLITNAVEAMMPGGGKLSIRSKLTRDKGWIEVEIADTGHGMSEDVQKKLFALSFTTKEKRMGLGLWWCKTFLQGIGGDISAKSKVGEGSTFTVRLPVKRWGQEDRE